MTQQEISFPKKFEAIAFTAALRRGRGIDPTFVNIFGDYRFLMKRQASFKAESRALKYNYNKSKSFQFGFKLFILEIN